MAYEVSYPRSFPATALADGLAIIRSGEIAERKTELGIVEYNVQGFVQGIFLGNPDGPFAAAEPTEDEQEILATFCAEASQAAGIAAGPFERVNWERLFKFAVEVLLPLLIKL